jgi:cycloeucalenol cycloisomerase
MTDAPSRWFSADPGKAWAERFFLLYSPVWILEVGVVMGTGALGRWDDAGFLAFSLLTSAPLLLVPALLHRRVPALAATPWHRSWWFKFNVWIFLFVWVGTYFLTHYFFDVLGMRYAFPTRWNLGAALVGRSRADVPAFMYPLTQAYFVTYHVAMLVVLRRVRRGLGDLSAGTGAWPRRLALVAVACGLAYAVAYAETLFMASDLIRDLFWYADKPRMLRWGSLFYACYFLVSLPLLYPMDEPPGPAYPLRRVVLEALAAGMLVMMILDGLALLLGPLV